jgi:putative copper resistance protein D
VPAALVRIAGAVVVAAGLVSLGIAMRGPLGLLQASWFGAMGRTWGPDPLVDQAHAGALLVVAGAVVLVTVVVVVLVRVRREAASRAPASASASASDGLRPDADIAPAHTGARRPNRGANGSASDVPDFDDSSDDSAVTR